MAIKLPHFPTVHHSHNHHSMCLLNGNICILRDVIKQPYIRCQEWWSGPYVDWTLWSMQTNQQASTLVVTDGGCRLPLLSWEPLSSSYW